MRRFFKRLTWVLIKRKALFKSQKLVFAFTDLDGNNYHRFENQDLMSMERLGELKKYFTWIVRGLSNIELEELVHQANEGIVLAMKSLDDRNKVSKYLANAISTHAEILMRSEKISNTELYYNLLAVQYIRHDEDPLEFSETIQKEKVIAFKAASGKLDSFFFALPEFTNLCRLLNITAAEWTAFQELSSRVMQRNQDVITLLKRKLSTIEGGQKNS